MTRNELADKIEAAEGPSRELDVEIALAAGWDLEPCGLAPFRELVAKFGMDWALETASCYTSVYKCLPSYTSSIDAALTLGSDFTERQLWLLWHSALTKCSVREKHIVDDLPRFICAAALRVGGDA